MAYLDKTDVATAKNNYDSAYSEYQTVFATCSTSHEDSLQYSQDNAGITLLTTFQEYYNGLMETAGQYASVQTSLDFNNAASAFNNIKTLFSNNDIIETTSKALTTASETAYNDYFLTNKDLINKQVEPQDNAAKNAYESAQNETEPQKITTPGGSSRWDPSFPDFSNTMSRYIKKIDNAKTILKSLKTKLDDLNAEGLIKG